MDGNNSLKLMDSYYRSGTDRADNRTVNSHRWVSEADVDRFKDEVRHRTTRKVCYYSLVLLSLT